MNRLLKVALLMSFLATTLLADGQMGSGGYQGCTGQNCPPCTVDCPPPCTEDCGRPQRQYDEYSVKVRQTSTTKISIGHFSRTSSTNCINPISLLGKGANLG